MVASRNRLLEQGALTAAALGAVYAIWLGLGLPAFPIPFPQLGGADGASKSALIVTQLPKGVTRTDATTFAAPPLTVTTGVSPGVSAARPSRTHGAFLGVTPPPVAAPVAAAATAPTQSDKTTPHASAPAREPVLAAVAAASSDGAPSTATQTGPAPPLPDLLPLPAVTVPSVPDATLPASPSLPATPQPDPLPQTSSPPAGLPELPSTPG